MAGAYLYFGFESAATIAEEVRSPRAIAPKAVICALALVIAVPVLLVVFALMAVPNLVRGSPG